MQHPTHIDVHEQTGAAPRIAAIIVIVAALCAIGGYVVYGSGLWHPQQQHDSF